MNNKAINFIRNFSYTLTTNMISLIVSTLVILIVPKVIGVEEYGYWQLYLFYSSYVGFLHFGWNDGVYLRYGGKEYKDLNKNLFFTQFYMLVLFQVLVGVLIFILSDFFVTNVNKKYIIEMITIVMIIVNTRYMLVVILQSTNRIREFAVISLIDKILYILLIISILLLGIRKFELLVITDLLAKSLSLLIALYFCRDIIFRKITTFYFSYKETILNINVGIKLMVANIASMLIIGIIRFGIEHSWDIETFGKVSLTLSVSNLMMLFINGLGIILFPILRRVDEGQLKGIYQTMRDLMIVILLGTLLIYYPLKGVLIEWLPKYADSLVYMVLVFPMIVYEGKMVLLINTYLKTMRKEKLMLQINLISLSLSIIITFLTTSMFKNLTLAILSIVILIAFKSFLAEYFLLRLLSISIKKDLVLEISLTSTFILTGWFLQSELAILFYAIAYIVYLIVKKKDIKFAIKNVKNLISS